MNGKRRSTEIQYAVGYVRVSSDEQAREDRFSLRAQRKEIQAYCERRGWILHEYIYEVRGTVQRAATLTPAQILSVCSMR